MTQDQSCSAVELDNVVRLFWDSGVGLGDRRNLSWSMDALHIQLDPDFARERFLGVRFISGVGVVDPQNDLDQSFHWLRRGFLDVAWVAKTSFAGRTRVLCCRGD